jgi:predicted nucleotidyltransferase
MRKNLLDLSGKISDFIIVVLEVISDVTNNLYIPFFVIGATARDVLLNDYYGIKTERATYDIDLGVSVDNWHIFENLTASLIATGHFNKKKPPQRLFYKDKFPVDIVPFGRISDPKNSIKWPPNNEIELSTLGFKESYDHSVLVRLRSNPILEVRFASLCGLALMKIISWDEKYPERSKDAKDLDFIMRNYIYAGNEERVYDEESDLFEREDIDYEYMSSRLLGRDIALMSEPKTKDKIRNILNHQTGEQNRYKMVEDMMNSVFRDDFEEKLNLLEELKKGLLERL